MGIRFNTKIKLILSDVDETIADVYTDATDNMIKALIKILKNRKRILFLISGGGYKSIYNRIVSKFPLELRHQILVGHCSGAEIVGYKTNGELNNSPYYSLYDKVLNPKQKIIWRNVIKKIISKFKLITHNPCPLNEFKRKNKNTFDVMYSDRGPQITIEFVNSYNLKKIEIKNIDCIIDKNKEIYDLRDYVLPYANELLINNNLPIEIDYGGIFAMDFKLKNVSKTTAVRYILKNKEILNDLGVNLEDINNPEEIEIWGDKFSLINGGSDRYMCFSVNPKVRAINFRKEDSSEFPKGYNIINWDGKEILHDGLLEYLTNI